MLNLRKLCPKKDAQLQTDKSYNERISRICYPVECFFGWLKQTWALFHNRYHFDHAKFDTDFDNCILLTNEIICQSRLTDSDIKFYHALLVCTTTQEEERTKKQKDQKVTFQKRKKNHLEQKMSISEYNNEDVYY